MDSKDEVTEMDLIRVVAAHTGPAIQAAMGAAIAVSKGKQARIPAIALSAVAVPLVALNLKVLELVQPDRDKRTALVRDLLMAILEDGSASLDRMAADGKFLAVDALIRAAREAEAKG